ncbi:hypothetical protein [Streptomyces mirabilis]|uniref:hypothetical protein n=1 Tax=Streptomyces mirabilis TaxID=68239 RepID=UPI0033309269
MVQLGDDPDDAFLNNGRDPMTGFMTALSNSPAAATDFFNRTDPQDNAEWVLKDRPAFDDTPLNSNDGNQSRDATGNALVAAATGVNPDDPHAVPVEHTAENRHLLDRSLKIISGVGDDFAPEMRDDMAKVLVNYGDEVNHTASSLADDHSDPRQLDRHQLLEVTKQVSRDQNAYGILNDGLNREMVRDIYADHPSDPKETLLRAGHTVGFLEEASAHQRGDRPAERRSLHRAGGPTAEAGRPVDGRQPEPRQQQQVHDYIRDQRRRLRRQRPCSGTGRWSVNNGASLLLGRLAVRTGGSQRRTRSVAAAAVTVVLLTATACSGSRDYAVPDKACGVTVDSDSLSPLLPNGKKLTEKSYDAGPESPRCRLLVDQQLVVYLSGDVVAGDTDPIKVQDRALVRLGSPAAADIGDDAVIADRGAMAVAGCAYKGKQQRFAVLVQLQRNVPENVSKRRDALRSFLRSYFPKAMEKQGCQ